MAVKRLLLVCMWAVTFVAGYSYGQTFVVADDNLQSCINKLVNKNNWQQVDLVTEIKCHSKGVKSLKGLEQFSNLIELSLYNNKVKRIDIDLTRLSLIKTINLARNNLDQVALAGLPQLESLYLFDNQLEHLQLSDLKRLQILKANNNKIETFSYSNLPQASKIYIFNNQLETINIYDLPALSYMDCRQNPMPDELYDEMDKLESIAFLHDGNAEDW